MLKSSWEHGLGLLGLCMFLWGCYQGLFVLPPDQFMGEVMRILYVHVPTAWNALLGFTLVFIASIGWLWQGSWRWDVLSEAALRCGLVLGTLLTIQGSIWAKPTWNVWWTWDPRLTTVAIMLITFGGIAALRSFEENPERRATWAAIGSILAFANVVLVYFSVKLFRSMHQLQSTPTTIDPEMVLVLRINAFAILFIQIWFIARHYRMIRVRRELELGETIA
jgi:heme exporter protein C